MLEVHIETNTGGGEETRTHTFTKLHENAGGASQEEETLTMVCK